MRGIKNIKSIKNIELFIIEAIFLLVYGIAVLLILHSFLGLSFSVLMIMLFFLLIHKINLSKPDFRIIINSLFESFAWGEMLSFFLLKVSSGLSNIENLIIHFCSIVILLLLFYIKNEFVRQRNKRYKTDEKPVLYFSVIGLIFCFIAFIDLPLEVFLNNSSEFSFSFSDVVYSMVPFLAGGIMVLTVISLLPAICIDVTLCLTGSLNVAIYIQFMFFNQYIGQLNGDYYHWKYHLLHTIINSCVWIVIVVAGLVIGIVKKKRNIILLANGLIGILLLVSLIFSIIKSPKEAFSRKQFFLSGEEQFTIGKNENVVLLIADAVDNKYIKEIIQNEPEFLDFYHDFTIYTDTCSVYDMTNTSVPQMLYGYTQNGNYDKAFSFMNCFSEHGYRMLFFDSEAFFGLKDRPNEYIDNYVFADDSDNILEVRYPIIRKELLRISSYKMTPCLCKPLYGIMEISLGHVILYKGKTDELINNNREFEEKTNLTYNDYSDKCFIYQHISGIHFPCDDYYQGSKDSLNIYKKYIDQMKELGIYNSSLIIVASDHGIHDDVDGVPFATATTPILFIKKPNEKHERVEISTLPVYYRDFQATILKYAGMYDDPQIKEQFGKAIDDYDDTSVRTRVWFDTGFNGQKIRKYTYTGDTQELERVVREGTYEEVDNLEFRESNSHTD